MGLLRLWDRSKGGVRIDKIAASVRKQETIEGLLEARSVTKHARSSGMVGAESILDEMRENLKSHATAFLEVMNKYDDNGEGAALLKKFRTLRHERLAHFDISATSAPEKNATDQEIDQFYSDSTNMVQVLRGLVLAEFFDPAEAADVHRYYAKYFWASVRGERTEGHPNFRPAEQ